MKTIAFTIASILVASQSYAASLTLPKNQWRAQLDDSILAAASAAIPANHTGTITYKVTGVADLAANVEGKVTMTNAGVVGGRRLYGSYYSGAQEIVLERTEKFQNCEQDEKSISFQPSVDIKLKGEAVSGTLNRRGALNDSVVEMTSASIEISDLKECKKN